MSYRSFNLYVSRKRSSIYRATLLDETSVEKSSISEDFEFRNDLKIHQILENIEQNTVGSDRENEYEDHTEFGKMLYSKVFSGDLGEYFDSCVQKARDGEYVLRISLRFDEDIPEIISLPWELLHDGKSFLVTDRNISLTRFPFKVKETESQPLDSILRMLVIISSPNDPRILPVNTEKEQEVILEAVDKLQKKQKIKVDFTEDATFENIQGYLSEQNYHIVHFTGNGINMNGKGYLVFESEDKIARLIDNEKLSNLFSGRGIRLVVLNSCESAKGSNKEAFRDLASVLSRNGIPAVVAMQYSVSDDVAINFAHNFYKTIACGKPVDLALTEARIAMNNSKKSNGIAFATPVLYLSDYRCVQVDNLKAEPSEFVFKSMMISDLQVMEKGFVARRKELRFLEKVFKSDIKHAAIVHGFGGIGKTVFATQFALKMGYYFEGTLGIKCTSSIRPEDILNKFNSFFLMRGRSELNYIMNQQVPLNAKTSLLVTILNQIRFLVIFDNFEDCLNENRNDIENPELKSFVQTLLINTTRNTKFLITTRYDFDPLEGRLSEGIEHISLSELQFPQTNWLMNNYKELADLDISKKKQIYDVIGGHPWTIGQFAVLASNQGVNDLLLDLQPLKKELIEFTLLDKSYSKLDPEAKKLLLSASIYEEAVPIEALSWIVGDEKDQNPSVEGPLQNLLQWGLISKEQKLDQTVYMEHAIVKEISLKKLEEERFDKKKSFTRAARYYENLVPQTKSIWDYLKARDYYFQAEDWKSASKIVEDIVDSLIRGGNIELAMDLLNESIHTTSGATKINSEYTLATIFHRLGDLNTALKMYNDIKYKYEETGNNKGTAGVLHEIGMIYQEQGNYDEAVKKYNQSLKIFDEMGDKKGIAQTLQDLGNIHYLQGNYDEAVKKYNHSLGIKEETGDKSGIAGTLHQLGIIHQNQGNYEEAVKKYDESLRIIKEIGGKSGIATTLHNLGMINQEQGNYEEAIKKYNQALKIGEELGSKSRIASTLHQLGVIYQEQGNYKEALNMYNDSLRIKKEIGNKSGTANTFYQLGMIYQEQGNFKDATELYNQCLEIENELGNKKGMAGTFHQLGKIYQLQGNIQEAINLYNQSLKIRTEIGDKRGIAVSLHSLGNIYFFRGDHENAIKSYYKSLHIFKKLGDKKGVSDTLGQIGMINQTRGKYKEAMKIYYKSLKMKEELGDKSGIAITLHQLGRLNEEMNEFSSAVRNYLISLLNFEQLNSPNKEIVARSLSRLRDKMGEEKFDFEFERLVNDFTS